MKLTVQNLNVKGTYVEGIKEEVVLSPGHALSFIAAGEGFCDCNICLSTVLLIFVFSANVDNMVLC